MERANDGGVNYLMFEGRAYPRVILGGDQFLDYWGPQRYEELSTVGGVYQVMAAAFEEGVRGYDLSMNAHVLEAFRQLKDETGGAAVGIANPNWKLNVMSGGQRLWDIRWRVVATVLGTLVGDAASRVREQQPGAWKEWFAGADDAVPLTDEEVSGWVFDEEDYIRRLSDYKGLADFCLVGSDYADWCIALDRLDIVKRQIQRARDEGFVPVSVSHLTSLSLGTLDELDCAGHWVMASLDRQLLSTESMLAAVASCRKPITAFQVLGHGRHAGHLREALAYVQETVRAQAVVIGVCTAGQSRETFGVLKEVCPDLWPRDPADS